MSAIIEFPKGQPPTSGDQRPFGLRLGRLQDAMEARDQQDPALDPTALPQIAPRTGLARNFGQASK